MIEQVLIEPGRMELREVPKPALAPGEALLKLEALTLCGSDVRVYTGEKTGGVAWPAIIGHEFVGRITEVAAPENEHLLGGRRTVMPWIWCGACGPCRRGQTNLCHSASIFGYQIPGGMSEYIRIPASAVRNGNLVEAPDSLAAEVMALSEPLACVYHGHLRCKMTVGSSVLILGGGPIGMLHTLLALRAGASRVIVSEPQASRAQTIRTLGDVITVDPAKADPATVARDLTEGEGVDVSLVCIGSAPLAQHAIDATRPGGIVNLFAGFGQAGIGELDLNAIHYNQLDVIGNVDATLDEFQTASGLIANGQVNLSSMITDRYPLSQAPKALEIARSGMGVKVAVIPD